MHNRHKNWEGYKRPFFSPFAWPRWLRIAFVVTLPISGPLWIASMTFGMIGYMAAVILSAAIIGPIFFAIELWERD